MARNDAAASIHVCPGIRIHVIDMAQPPAIGIFPIADIDPHQTIVSPALPAKSSADAPKKVCCEDRPETMSRDLLGRSLIRRLPDSLKAGRICRGGVTRRSPRYGPLGGGRATGTCPKGHPARANRRNRCG